MPDPSQPDATTPAQALHAQLIAAAEDSVALVVSVPNDGVGAGLLPLRLTCTNILLRICHANAGAAFAEAAAA